MILPKMVLLIGWALFVGFLWACSSPTPAAPVAGVPNPASVYCQQQGGKLEIRKDAQGEAGYCVFSDKSECEEWAFLRGECKPGAKPTGAAAAADPFAYCATAGNLDAPDARWTGTKMPDVVLTGLIQAAQISPNMGREQLAQSSFWRCMNGKVYACTIGANLPCQEKADMNKTPGAALNDFCRANPNATVVPAAVTGRATVYEWECVSGAPQVLRQLFQSDARGFLSDFWYEIAPPALTGVPTQSPTRPTLQPTPAAKRITFAPGGISATVQGTTRAVDVDRWVIAAQVGQTMTVNLIVPPGGQAALVIYGVDGTVLVSDNARAMQWTGPLPKTQDYFIGVKPETGAVSYTMQVTIPPR